MNSAIKGDLGAACVLISLGAILGKVSLIQMLVLATAECIFFSFNENFCQKILGANDAGGAMTIHLFGATFGLLAAICINKTEKNKAAINYEIKL